jgi:Ca2+/H+ antiporter
MVHVDLKPTATRTPPATDRVARKPPWYRDLRFSFGVLAAPVFFFADQIVSLVAPGLAPENSAQLAQAVQFVAGAILLFPLSALIELVTEYYEHNFRHRHDRNGALLRAGLLHTSFTNIAFLILMIFTLREANTSSDASTLIRIVQVSIAGTIVVSILFSLGVAIFIGGLNIRRHGGRMNFSKELSNQDAELITIAVVILSLPTLASVLNVSPSFLDNVVYKLPQTYITNLSVVISIILIFIYVSYFFWTLLRVGDVKQQTKEDIEGDVIQTIFRAINKVWVSRGEISLYDALRSPSIIYPDAETESRDMQEVQAQMDTLDASLEQEEQDEYERVQRMAEENKRREQARRRLLSLRAPVLLIENLLVAAIFIVVSPVLALWRLVNRPYRLRRARQKEQAALRDRLASLPESEVVRRAERDQRLGQEEADELRHESLIQVLARIGLLLLGGGGAVFVLDRMARSIEGGLVEGLGLNPFFVGFIVLPIAAGLVDIVTATRKAWHNDLQNTLAITAGSAIQSALVVGPVILLLSRLPFVALPDINLVFGLFILAVFGLIAYFYQIMTVDGETTWFEGAQLLGIFTAVAVVVYFAQPVGH